MFELAQPFYLLLLLLLIFWGSVAWRRTQGEAPAWVLHHPGLPAADEVVVGGTRQRVPLLLTLVSFALLVLALAQPREVGDWITPPPEGRDIVLLIDTSQTMSIRDFKLAGREVERLDVLKATIARFIEGRTSDRFGVIAFGSHVATLTPPTFDHTHVIAALQRLQVGMLGDDTALGDALGFALKQLQPGKLRPVIILVSDGADSNTGTLTPAEAAAVARHLGVAIHSVQIGSDLFATGRAPVVRDADRQPGLSELSRQTQGRHYFVRSTEDAERVIQDIGKLEKTLARPAQTRQMREWYWLPLLLATLLLVAAHIVRVRLTP